MRVYVDLLFLFNGLVDATLLVLAGWLCRVPLRPWRLLVGATWGGVYGVGAALLPWRWAFGPPLAAVAAALMVVLAFAPVPLRLGLRLLTFLYGGAALLAGLVLLLTMAAGPGALPGVPWWAVALALGGCLALGVLTWDRWGPGRSLRWQCDLEVTLAGRRATCRALVDTGNLLRGPWGDGPAVLVEAPVLRGLLPAALLSCLAGGPAGIPEALAEVSAASEPGGGWSRRVRLIPFRTVGTHGVLCGLRPDDLRLRAHGRWFPVRAVVGVSPGPLSADTGYHALVPACLLVAAEACPRAAPPPHREDGGEGRGIHGAVGLGL
jgi:stage II sporulation protein GA (sporulation sigma-E factor processing peptidase)